MSAKPQELKQEKLHDFIDELQLGLIGIDNAISQTYFYSLQSRYYLPAS